MTAWHFCHPSILIWVDFFIWRAQNYSWNDNFTIFKILQELFPDFPQKLPKNSTNSLVRACSSLHATHDLPVTNMHWPPACCFWQLHCERILLWHAIFLSMICKTLNSPVDRSLKLFETATHHEALTFLEMMRLEDQAISTLKFDRRKEADA